MLDRVAAGYIPRKHHIAHRDADGRLLYEHCVTRDGFDGPYTIAYHRERPHTQRAAEVNHGWPAAEPAPPRPLAKRHYKSGDLPRSGGPAVDARTPLLFNADVVVGLACPDAEDPVYVVNGDGDELLYVHEGGGLLRSALGDLRFESGDYVYIPKGLVYRLVPDEGAQTWLSIQSGGGVGIPKQWRNPVGQLRMDAPYCHRDFRRPEFSGPRDEGIRELVVKREGRFSGYAIDHSPLDVVGWDGTVYPWAFPILNFQPRAGLVHLPPTWHGTFAAPGALVCSFVPRVVDFHPEAVPCPYPHSSVDCDEIIFYCRGNFTSRRGVGPGSISHHPAGLPHGPHPGAYEASLGTHKTDELAVMMDTYRPLAPTAQALAVEDAGYQQSFV